MVVRTAVLDSTFRALADPTRRALLTRLREGSASVAELAEPFDVSQQAVSKHIAVLKETGLLEQRKEGRVHRCSLRPEPLAEASEWIERYREVWEERFDNLSRYLKKKRGRRNG